MDSLWTLFCGKSYCSADNGTTTCGADLVESKLTELPSDERTEYLKSLGVDESGLGNLIGTTCALLGLRRYFTYGEKIYSVGVSVFLGGNKLSRTGDIRGDISVNFTCDPDISRTLVDIALDEILCLQQEGPSVGDISTILETEQRAHENGLQVMELVLKENIILEEQRITLHEFIKADELKKRAIKRRCLPDSYTFIS